MKINSLRVKILGLDALHLTQWNNLAAVCLSMQPRDPHHDCPF